MPSHDDNKKKFIFYSIGDGTANIRVFIQDEDTWVTQAGMTQIFGVGKSSISEHLKNIFEVAELDED